MGWIEIYLVLGVLVTIVLSARQRLDVATILYGGPILVFVWPAWIAITVYDAIQQRHASSIEPNR